MNSLDEIHIVVSSKVVSLRCVLSDLNTDNNQNLHLATKSDYLMFKLE